MGVEVVALVVEPTDAKPSCSSSPKFSIKPYQLIECKYNTEHREAMMRYIVTPCHKCYVVGFDIVQQLVVVGLEETKHNQNHNNNDQAAALTIATKMKGALERMGVDYGHCLAEAMCKKNSRAAGGQEPLSQYQYHDAYTENFAGGFAFGPTIIISLSLLKSFIQTCCDGEEACSPDENARSFVLDFVDQLEKDLAYMWAHNTLELNDS